MTRTNAYTEIAASMTLTQVAEEIVKADPTAPLVDLLDAARDHHVFEARAELVSDDEDRYAKLGDLMDTCIVKALEKFGAKLDESRVA